MSQVTLSVWPAQVTQNLGDAFPDTDKIKPPQAESIGFGMGQYAKYVFMHPEENVVVSTFGQSEGHELACDAAYDDGYTLSLIWNAVAKALAVPPSEEDLARAATETPAMAPRLGSPRPAGDRTHATVRAEMAALQAAEEHLLAAVANGNVSDDFVGACSCTCPPDEGFGKCFNIPKSFIVGPPPADGAQCPMLMVAKFPPAYAFCPVIGYPTQCDPSQVGNVFDLIGFLCMYEGHVGCRCFDVADSVAILTAKWNQMQTTNDKIVQNRQNAHYCAMLRPILIAAVKFCAPCSCFCPRTWFGLFGRI